MLPKIEEIQRRRKLLKLTQKKLALLSGVSQSLIAKIETNRIDPSYKNVKKIFITLDLEEKKNMSIGKAKDIHNTKIIGIQKSGTIIEASHLMNKHGYSQLIVYEDNIITGSISEENITNYISKEENLESLQNIKVKDIMSSEFPQIEETTPLEPVTYLLKHSPAVLTTRKGKVVGMITKADLFKLIIK